MRYEGFVGLTMAQATTKNAEFKHEFKLELKEHWKAFEDAGRWPDPS